MPLIKHTDSYHTQLFKVWDKDENRWLNNQEMKDTLELKFEYARAWVEVIDRERYEIIKPHNDYFYIPEKENKIFIACQKCQGKEYPFDMSINKAGEIICPDCYESHDSYDEDLIEYVAGGD